MALATIKTRASIGVEAPGVAVEVHLSGGLPGLAIVGLPETAVRESKERVRAALQNTRFDYPQRRVTVNLAPADLPKDGGGYDLAIALGVLAASGQIAQAALNDHEFLGELSLSGELRPVRGALPAALAATRAGRRLIVPTENAPEAALVTDARVYAAAHLLDVVAHLKGESLLNEQAHPSSSVDAEYEFDLSDVRGQHRAKRALEIAAAGAHSLLMIGPPGSGKSMLATRLPSLLPPMTDAEALESAAIASVSQIGFDAQRFRQRPVRSPHHTASGVALVGGGGVPRPGEISLAHNGVLFLDELPEFDRKTLEVMREPLETGEITISRAARQATFPAHFQMICAMNPCPRGDDCSEQEIARYRDRLSEPLLDRIDMHLAVPRVHHSELRVSDQSNVGETSAQVRQRVCAARDIQLSRSGKANARMSSREVERFAQLGDSDHRLLEQAMERLRLSARSYHRILRLARTIADLANSPGIRTDHLTEALSLRQLDRAKN